MAKTYNKMQIDMNGDILSTVTAVTQDTLSRYLDCSLYNNGVTLDLTGHMAQLYIKKPEPDGLTVLTQGKITDAAAGRVQFELTNQTLAVTGWLDLQIVLTSGEGEVLSSEIFKLHVLPSIRSDEAIESTNEFGALVVLFQEIQNSLDLMKAMVDAFGKPGEVAKEYGATTFWEILEAVIGRVDVEKMLKTYINSTIKEGNFLTLDRLLGAKIVCRGTPGTTFTIKHMDGIYSDLVAEITENSKKISGELYAVVVPVPCGSYEISIDMGGVQMDASVEATSYGEHYTFGYSSFVEIARFTEDGTLIIPDDVTEIFVTAAAGGGGGGGADLVSSKNYYGGGAGSGGECIVKKKFTVTPSSTHKIVIGKGGKGGTTGIAGTNGGDGGATVIGSLITLAGGIGGEHGGVGSTGENGGADGGDGGKYETSNVAAEDGEDSTVGPGKGGKAGATGPKETASGGGGGASIGDGGNGCGVDSNGVPIDGTDGEDGAGGGGGCWGDPDKAYEYTLPGTDGGNGIVIVYKGVSIE